MPQFVAFGAPDDLDRMLKEMEDLKEKLLACITEKDRRKKVLAMMEVMGESFASPMSLEVGSIEVTGDQADVALLMKIDPAFAAQGGVAGTAEGSEPEIAEYLVFVKKEMAHGSSTE